MCKAFSCVVKKKSKKVYWKMGLDSHEDIKKHFKLDDTKLGNLVPIEIFPKDYLNMTEPKQNNKDWTFKFDENCPRWWNESYDRACWSCCFDWYNKVIKLVNWKGVRNIINPFEIKITRKVTIKHKLILKKWASVWDSVRDSVGDSVQDSVWASVGALFYLKRTQWKYTEKIKTKGYPFQSCVDLWKQGLAPSFDGTYWRLHSGKKSKVVFKISQKDLRKINQR